MPSAFLSAHGIGDALIALPAAIAVSMLFAWLTGIVCLRTKGVYFIMITLAFGQMVYFIATSLAPYGGDNGLTIAARNTIAGWPLLKSDRAFYYVTLVCLLATYLFAARWSRRASAACCAAAKENATRMATPSALRSALSAHRLHHRRRLGGLSGFLLANSTEFVARLTCPGSNPAN
jgi:branched-chain amino acid transport system permease protein